MLAVRQCLDRFSQPIRNGVELHAIRRIRRWTICDQLQAVTHYKDAGILAEVSKGLGEAMVGISARSIPSEDLLAPRGV